MKYALQVLRQILKRNHHSRFGITLNCTLDRAIFYERAQKQAHDSSMTAQNKWPKWIKLWISIINNSNICICATKLVLMPDQVLMDMKSAKSYKVLYMELPIKAPCRLSSDASRGCGCDSEAATGGTLKQRKPLDFQWNPLTVSSLSCHGVSGQTASNLDFAIEAAAITMTCRERVE